MIDHARITKLPNDPDERHHAARVFCLKIIKSTYNIDYKPLWHADLDSLLSSATKNWYSSTNKGAFWIYQQEDGEIVGTCGIYDMVWKKETSARLAAYYADRETVCQLSRMYIKAEFRNQGIGSRLNSTAISEATSLNYHNIYLHADGNTASTLAFWDNKGYRTLGIDKINQIVDFNIKLASL